MWHQDKDEDKAFLQLKVALTTTPILHLLDLGLQFVITTDANNMVLGAMLKQDFKNGLQPIAYAS